jgi:hypothetical protein
MLPARSLTQAFAMKTPILLTGFLAVALSACGYHAINTAKVYGFDTLAVVPFAEETPLGLSSELAGDLSARLATGGIKITANEGTAGAVLTGRVLAATAAVSPVARFGLAVPAYDMTVRLEVDLIPKGKKSIWHRQFSIREDFLAAQPSAQVTGSATDLTLATEANRRTALTRVAEKATQEIIDALLMDSTLAPETH